MARFEAERTTDERMAAQLTEVATAEFENGSVFVYFRGGVYWLALRQIAGGYRTLRSIGSRKDGLRRMAAVITELVEDY